MKVLHPHEPVKCLLSLPWVFSYFLLSFLVSAGNSWTCPQQFCNDQWNGWIPDCTSPYHQPCCGLFAEMPMFSLIKYNHHDSRGMRVWRTTSTASLLHRSFAACSVARGFPGGSDRQESACSAGDPGSIPGFGRSPGEENGNPLQYSCLENSMDRKA